MDMAVASFLSLPFSSCMEKEAGSTMGRSKGDALMWSHPTLIPAPSKL